MRREDGIGSAGAATAALLLCLTAACAAHATATPQAWQLRGVVTSVDAPAVTVRQYKTERLYRLVADEHTAGLLTVGTRVTVDVETQAGVHHAVRFHVFGSGQV